MLRDLKKRQAQGMIDADKLLGHRMSKGIHHMSGGVQFRDNDESREILDYDENINKRVNRQVFKQVATMNEIVTPQTPIETEKLYLFQIKAEELQNAIMTFIDHFADNDDTIYISMQDFGKIMSSYNILSSVINYKGISQNKKAGLISTLIPMETPINLAIYKIEEVINHLLHTYKYGNEGSGRKNIKNKKRIKGGVRDDAYNMEEKDYDEFDRESAPRYDGYNMEEKDYDEFDRESAPRYDGWDTDVDVSAPSSVASLKTPRSKRTLISEYPTDDGSIDLAEDEDEKIQTSEYNNHTIANLFTVFLRLYSLFNFIKNAIFTQSFKSVTMGEIESKIPQYIHEKWYRLKGLFSKILHDSSLSIGSVKGKQQALDYIRNHEEETGNPLSKEEKDAIYYRFQTHTMPDYPISMNEYDNINKTNKLAHHTMIPSDLGDKYVEKPITRTSRPQEITWTRPEVGYAPEGNQQQAQPKVEGQGKRKKKVLLQLPLYDDERNNMFSDTLVKGKGKLKGRYV